MLKLEAFENYKGQTFCYVSLDGCLQYIDCIYEQNQSKYKKEINALKNDNVCKLCLNIQSTQVS